MNNLGALYSQQRRFPEAEPLFVEFWTRESGSSASSIRTR